jgi:predicted enzyme related to lactoylglutathione lyase
MASPFVHLELNTTDSAAAKKFYGEMFGWTFNDVNMDGGMVYSLFKPDSGPGGGLFSIPDAPIAWLAYIEVESIHAATEKAKAIGAMALTGVQEVPGMGWMSVLKDPQGASIALWQPKKA